MTFYKIGSARSIMSKQEGDVVKVTEGLLPSFTETLSFFSEKCLQLHLSHNVVALCTSDTPALF